MITSCFKKVAYLSIFFSVYIIQAQESFYLLGYAKKESSGVYELTPDQLHKVGLMISLFPIDLTQKFSKTFELSFGGKDYSGADGMTFSFLNSCSIGSVQTGQDLGMKGIIESLFVEFDTFQNIGRAVDEDFNDPVADHMAIMSRGDANHYSANHITDPIEMENIENGEYHRVTVTWTPHSNNTQTFEVEFTHSNGTTYRRSATSNFINNIFGGNSIVFWGFSASTGGSSSIQRVRIQEDKAEKYSCKGNTITLEAPLKGQNYFWTSDSGTAIPNNRKSSISVSPSETTEYICHYIDYCNRPNQTVKYKVYVAEFSENHVDPTCNQQGIVTLSVKDGKAPYTYTLDGKTITSQYETYTFTNLIEGSHTYEIKTAGCSYSGDINIKNAVPSAPSVSDQRYCAGDSKPPLEVSNPNVNYTYTWYDSSGTSVYTGVQFSPSVSSGTFTVTATDKTTNCVSTATKVDLTQYPKPTITLNVNPTCSADLKTYSFTVSSESGNDISTDDNQASIQDNANGTWTIRVPMATAKNTISVTAKNKEGCNMTQPFNKPNCSCPVIPAPNASDEAYCEGSQKPALEVNNPDTTNYTYTWYDESGKEVNEGTSLDYSKLSDPAITSGTFTVTATDKTKNCVSTATKVDLTQYPKPTITLNVNPTCSADLKTYSFTVSSESGNDISTDDNQASIQDNANGTWTIRVPMATAKNTISVTAKNKEGCNMTQPFNKPNCSCPVIPTPNASDEAYCEGSQKPALEVNNPDTTNYTYTWYDESGKEVNEGTSLDYSKLSDPAITSGTFTVTATDKIMGCVSTATKVDLTQYPKPTITLNVNPTCSADLKTYSFTVSSESGNDISTDDNQASIQDNANGTWTIRVPMATAKNTISVTAKNKEGCNMTQPFNKPNCSCPVIPTPNASDEAYCEGSQRPALEVNNPDTTNYTYTWYDESGKEVNEGTSLDYSKLSDPAITSGTFTVTATDKIMGCVSTATKVDLTQYPKPTITLNVNPTCSADLKTYSFTVSSESGNDISTDDNQASIQDNANGTWTIRVPMATAKNTISVTAKNKEGCNMTQPFNKPNCSCPVIPTPNASDEAYCEGSQRPALEVNNPDTTNYTYTWYDESGKEVNEGTSLDYSKLSDPAITSGTFTVTATDKTTNCVSTATKVDLTQYPKPTITLNVNPTCSADLKTYSFTVSSESGNDISTDDNQASIQDNANGTWTIRVPMATAKNTISVTAKNKEGCNMTQPFNKPNCSCPVIPTPNASDEAYCEGSQKPALEVSNPNVNYTYTWYDSSGTSVYTGVKFSPSVSSGTFTVTATDKTKNCVSTATTVKLIENPQPTLSVTANHPVLFYGQPFKLYSNPSSDSSYKLSWKGPNGFRSQQENPVIPSVHSNHSGTYELNLSNTLNCSAASQFSLQVYTDVETALGEDVISCSDGTSFTFSYPQVSGLTYLWSGPNNFSSTQNQITVNETGIYTLTVRASDGNESVGSVQIKASDLRVEKLNTCLAQTIVNPSGGRPPYEYSLDGVTFQSSPVFKGDFRTAHTIYVRDGNSCEVREEAKGVKFDLYEAFSPNGDGINDRWDLSALSGCVKAQVKIFDRYGRYVHLMQLNNLSWDGRVKGKPLPSGTYWYVIEFNDGVTPLVKGNLTIKRRKD